MLSARVGRLRDGDTAVRVLGAIGWGIVVVAGIAGFIINPSAGSTADESVLVLALTVFFLVLIARLIVAVFQQRNRRPALIAFTVGVLPATEGLDRSGEAGVPLAIRDGAVVLHRRA